MSSPPLPLGSLRTRLEQAFPPMTPDDPKIDPDPHGSFAARLRERFGASADPNISLGHEDAGRPASSSGELFKRLSSHTPDTTRYEILEEIGRGGMGAVFKVWDEDLRRTLAMKVILGQARGASDSATPAIEPHKLARFLEEAQVTGQLDHPGIVPVHELGLDASGRVFFTMRLVKGRDLKQIIDLVRELKEGWTQTKALGVILRVCEAMAYAHSKGVIHRDLKPANIMVGRFGETYVMDWGLAKVLGHDDVHDLRLRKDTPTDLSIVRTERKDESNLDPGSPLVTMDGTIFGTPAYMSPEQALGKLEQIGVRSDVYSVGAMLYHLLAGQMAYVPSGTTISAHVVWKWLIEGPPQALAEIRPDVPDELVAICEKAMARAADDRYRDTMEMADDLQAYLEGRVVQAYETGAIAEFKKWVARNKGIAWTSAAAIMLSIGLLSAIVYVQIKGKHELELKNSELATANTRIGEARDEVLAANNGLQQTNQALVEARNLARTNETQALENEARARRQSYVANILAAQASIAANEINDARRRLASCDEALRNWEWKHLMLAVDASLAHLDGHTAKVRSVAFSPDGSRIASAADDQSVRIWNADTGVELARLTGHTDRVNEIAYSPDGKWIATCSDDHSVRIWNAATGEALSVLTPRDSAVTALAIHPDGQRIAVGTSFTVGILERTGGKPLVELRGHRGTIHALAFSPDGARLVSAGADKTVRVWDIAKATNVATMQAHTGRVSAVAFSPDGTHIASGSFDKTVRLWNPTSDENIELLRDGAAEIVALAFSRDGSRLACSPSDGTVRVLDSRSGQPIAVLRGASPIACLSFSADGSRLVSGADNGAVRTWDVRTPEAVSVLYGHDAEVSAVRFDPDGRRLATTARDSTVRVWDARTWEPALIIRDYIPQGTLAFSPDGSQMAVDAITEGGKLGDERLVKTRILDAHSGASIALIANHEDGVLCNVFSPDGKLLASSSNDGTISVRDAHTLDAVATLRGHEQQVRAIEFSPDSTHLVSGSFDKTVRVWNALTGEQLRSLAGHEGPVRAVDYSPDGKRIVSASSDKTLRIWDAESGEVLSVLAGHDAAVLAAVYSPDGSRIASGGDDKTVRVWDATGGEALVVLRGHDDAVLAVDFSPDGARIASCSGDRTVRVWESAGPQQRYAARLVQTRLRQSAEPLVDALFERWVDCARVVDALRADFSLADELRNAATDVARVRGDNPADLNQRSWSIARARGRSAEEYALAVRFARAACERKPSTQPYLVTLGAAQYRVGEYEHAIETLGRATTFSRGRPAASVFLALAQERLGQHEIARAEMKRVRALFKDSRWSKDEESLALVHEGEELILQEADTQPAAK